MAGDILTGARTPPQNAGDILRGALGFPSLPPPAQPPTPPPPVTPPPTTGGGSANPQTPVATDPLTTLADLYAGLSGGTGTGQPNYLVNPVAGDTGGAASTPLNWNIVVGVLVLAVLSFVAYRFWKRHHHGKKAA